MYLKFIRNWRLFLVTILLIAGLLMFLGDLRVIAYTVSSDWHEQDILDDKNTAYSYGIGNQTDIFDLETVHTIKIEIAEKDYESMFLTYLETGEKEYFPIDIEIDGLLIQNVGIRLKGNSSLGSVLNMMGPEFNTSDTNNSEIDPWSVKVPFMLKFDEYIDGQNYQGHTKIALRNGFKDEAFIDEILAYSLLAEMDIEASEVSYGGVTINEMTETLYVLVEPVDEEFLEESFEDDPIGDLIKSELGGKIIYKGDDPTKYTDSFELKTNENESDLKDLIEFFKFYTESSNEEFEKDLNKYMDMDSLLKYMVFCNFTVNMDSFAGNGNNYYLYQDPDTETFTIIPWDLNQAFGGFWRSTGVAMQLDILFKTDTNQTPQIPNPNTNIKDTEGINGNLPPRPGQFPYGQTNPEGMPLQKIKPKESPLNEIPIRDRRPVTRPQDTSSAFVQKVLSIDSFQTKYLEIYEEMMDSLFTKEHLLEKIEQITEIALNENTERNYLDMEEYREKLNLDKSFILGRIEFVKEALYTLKQ